MVKKLLLGTLALALASPAVAAQAEPVSPVSVTTTTAALPPVDVSGCTTGIDGDGLVCASVYRDGDGDAGASACAYDGALAVLGWADGWELSCTETTEGGGFVDGAGVCERVLNTENPQACINGRDRCLVWVVGVRFVCWAAPPQG